ncbi:LAQU0S02e00386g1_1 [Lachancea quebecensis]|uniref:LAQU0S02e00386g1_1 n=1 Tax=Lachancea quebecensis TaxID=1654605 RepID=A0A0P1KQ27_9SACH|nr:LAQU0S02e00386g1_1 [Lachancea quebecensis]
MAKTKLPYWIIQLQLAYRNSSKQRKFSYKRNARKISQRRLQSVQKSLISNIPEVELRLASRFSHLPVANLQEYLIQDICEDEPKLLRLCVPELTSGSEVVENWDEISGLFKNLVGRQYKTDSELQGSTSYKHVTVRKSGNARTTWGVRLNLSLSSEGDLTEAMEVLWPPLEFSYCCRAVGTTHETITKMQQKGVKALLHPLTGDELPVLELDSLPPNASAVALVPSLEESDRKYFEGPLLAYSIIPSRLCSKAETLKLESLCVNQGIVKRPAAFGAIEPIVADGFKSDIRRVSRLFKALSSGSLFNPGLSTRSQMCSPDILRATIMSNRINDDQLKEEYCKIAVLYNVYENAQRLQKRLKHERKIAPGMHLSLWDELILHRLEELNKVSMKEDLNAMVRGKIEFDEFLADLNLYNTIINAELRGGTRPDVLRTHSRQHVILRILSVVLTQCKCLKNIYPSLSFAFRNLEIFARDAKLFKKTGNIEDAQEVFSIAKAITEVDNIATAKQQSLKNHKIILLTKSQVPSNLARVYQFLTKVEVQITDKLDAAKEVKNSQCIFKKLVRYDTYCYLYLRKERQVDIQEFLGSLEKPRQTLNSS